LGSHQLAATRGTLRAILMELSWLLLFKSLAQTKQSSATLNSHHASAPQQHQILEALDEKGD